MLYCALESFSTKIEFEDILFISAVSIMFIAFTVFCKRRNKNKTNLSEDQSSVDSLDEDIRFIYSMESIKPKIAPSIPSAKEEIEEEELKAILVDETNEETYALLSHSYMEEILKEINEEEGEDGDSSAKTEDGDSSSSEMTIPAVKTIEELREARKGGRFSRLKEAQNVQGEISKIFKEAQDARKDQMSSSSFCIT